jgi:hypothetical protein
MLDAQAAGDLLSPTPEKFGIIGLLALAVIAFFRGWIVTAAAHERLRTDCFDREKRLMAERDEFKDMALRGLELTERTIAVAQKVKETP